MHLIGRPGRSLRRGIEASQALDGVADELDADRLGVGRGKHVDDAAADGEGAVLVDRIFAGEAGIHEQVRQSLRLDLRAGAKLDRGAQQALLRTHARQQRRRRGDDQPRRSAAAAWSARARAAATRKCGVMPRYGST